MPEKVDDKITIDPDASGSEVLNQISKNLKTSDTLVRNCKSLDFDDADTITALKEMIQIVIQTLNEVVTKDNDSISTQQLFSHATKLKQKLKNNPYDSDDNEKQYKIHKLLRKCVITNDSFSAIMVELSTSEFTNTNEKTKEFLDKVKSSNVFVLEKFHTEKRLQSLWNRFRGTINEALRSDDSYDDDDAIVYIGSTLNYNAAELLFWMLLHHYALSQRSNIKDTDVRKAMFKYAKTISGRNRRTAMAIMFFGLFGTITLSSYLFHELVVEKKSAEEVFFIEAFTKNGKIARFVASPENAVSKYTQKVRQKYKDTIEAQIKARKQAKADAVMNMKTTPKSPPKFEA